MASGLIPDDIIDLVRKQSDIVEVVGKYVHLTKRGKYMVGLCPFHSEKTPSFTVTPEIQIFHCYGCGKGGSVYRFVEEIEGYSFPEAVKLLAEEAGIPVTWETNQDNYINEQDISRIKIIEAHDLAVKFYNYLLNNTKQGEEAKHYLLERGLTDKLIDHFMIGYAPTNWDSLATFLEKRGFDLALMEKGGLVLARHEDQGYVDRFRARIMFPIWDRNGKPIGFSGRILGEGQPKYLNTSETIVFTKSRILYNLHHARPTIKKNKKLVLFEGYMDVIKAWSADVTNGIATMGTALTDDQVSLIKRHADEVIICYDGDQAGQAAILKSISILETAGLKVQVALLPSGTDPDEYITQFGAEAFRYHIIEESVSVTKFKLLYFRKNFVLTKEEGRRQYINEAIKVIAQLDLSTEREMFLKEISKEFDLSIDALRQDCNEYRIEQQKLLTQKHNNEISWNNGRNEKRNYLSNSTVLPAYVIAERRLLHVMMRDRDVALSVHSKLNDAFNVKNHAAIAAYLYAYYASGHEADAAKFVSTLEDHELETAATELLMIDGGFPFDEQIMNAWLSDIQKVPTLKELQLKKELMLSAERTGDALTAATIANEIISLERKLKNHLN